MILASCPPQPACLADDAHGPIHGNNAEYAKLSRNGLYALLNYGDCANMFQVDLKL